MDVEDWTSILFDLQNKFLHACWHRVKFVHIDKSGTIVLKGLKDKMLYGLKVEHYAAAFSIERIFFKLFDHSL